MLKVKEIFYSLQGEGLNAGRPAVFVRFAGCNLWSGLEKDREKSPCYFCDTNFRGGFKTSEDALIEKILSLWPHGVGQPLIVFTGGEPTLQLKDSLIAKLRVALRPIKGAVNIAIETNGETDYEYEKPVWITVSPKTKEFVRRDCGELKLLWPLKNLHPDDIGYIDTKYKWLQPIDDVNYKENLRSAVEYCLQHPDWRVSLQQHKIMGIE